METIISQVLTVFMMVAPTASDTAVEHDSFPISMYSTIDECQQALVWIDDHQEDLDRHLWCSVNP